MANELERRDGLLRQRPILRESVLVGRILSGISARVSSTVLPAAEATDATSCGMAATTARKQTAVSSTDGRKATGSISTTRWRETAESTDGRKTARSTEWGKTARGQTACNHSTGAATTAITARRVWWAAINSTSTYVTANNATSRTRDYPRATRIPTEHTKRKTGGSAECIFGFNRGPAGKRARESQLESA